MTFKANPEALANTSENPLDRALAPNNIAVKLEISRTRISLRSLSLFAFIYLGGRQKPNNKVSIAGTDIDAPLNSKFFNIFPMPPFFIAASPVLEKSPPVKATFLSLFSGVFVSSFFSSGLFAAFSAPSSTRPFNPGSCLRPRLYNLGIKV